MNACTHPCILIPRCASSQFQWCKEPYLCCSGGRKPPATRWSLNLSSCLADPDCLKLLGLAKLFKDLSTKKAKSNLFRSRISSSQPFDTPFAWCGMHDKQHILDAASPWVLPLACYPVSSQVRSRVKTAGPQSHDTPKV